MFTETLLPDTVGALQLVANVPIVKKAYLAGGTALALHIGHRISVDLDFFTQDKFDENEVAMQLSALPQFKEESKSYGTVLGMVGKTKFSVFEYKYPLLGPTVKFEGVEVADRSDIAAMKVNALESRGTKRDFIDVFFLSKEFSLEQMFEFYDQKYHSLDTHIYSIIRSLDYFADADSDEKEPQMLINTSWGEVKQFFQSESLRLAKTKLKL